MAISTIRKSDLSAVAGMEPTLSETGVWRVYEFAEVHSTNLVAAALPAWHAVRADTQTTGRGRFQRDWVSDRGGLWMSAVVPLNITSPAARIFPLASGLALCEVLRDLGVKELRMRWPNDVLVGGKKLAGLLIDQIVPGLAIVGIGVNVTNKPEEQDEALRDQVARLSDVVCPTPTLDEFMRAVLTSIESVWRELDRLGPETLLPRINALWRTPLPVQLHLDAGLVTGQFDGVDARGRLQLRSEETGTQLFEPHEVRLLREITELK